MKKQGISLITLVITIVIVIILAGAVILNLADNNPIKSATQAVVMQDVDTFKTDLMLKLTSVSIFDTENINALTKDDIIKYIPSMENKKIGSTYYTDILVVSEGKLKVDGTKANEAIENKKLTQEQYDWIVEALGGSVFNAQTYSIKYYLNDGTENFTESSKIHNVKYSILANSSGRENYGFAGWNTKEDGTGTAYSAGDEYTENAELVLYAQWKANTFTITYYKNDGTEEARTEVKNADVPYEITAQDFTREGYTFEGWNTQADLSGESYPVGSSYEINAPLDLYAKWKANLASITINPNGGSVTVTIDGATETITESKTYSRQAGTKLSYSKPSKVIAGNPSETYTVTLDTNGGTTPTTTYTSKYVTNTIYNGSWNKSATFSGEITSLEGAGTYTFSNDFSINDVITANYDGVEGITQSKKESINLPVPTWNNHIFDGWYNDCDLVSNNYTPTENVTLKAVWHVTGSATANATEVKNNAMAYYGSYVNYTPSNGCPEKWQIFYSDNSKIYLIADDCVENKYLTSTGLTKSKSITDSSDNSVNFKYYCVYSSISRQDLVTRLTTSSYYTGFKDGAGKASFVVGAPNIVQVKNSYNDTHSTDLEIKEVENGYLFKLSNWEDYKHTGSIDANPKKLYAHISNDRASYYWIASFCGGESSRWRSTRTMGNVFKYRRIFELVGI